jgi:peptidoglycan/LPS O-acetylase OafA/YrhL
MLNKKNLDILTSYRGIASLWVVLYHYGSYFEFGFLEKIITYGYMSVDFFFILSGFILSWVYMDTVSYQQRNSIFDFYIRRLVRIYPLILLTLIVYLSIPILYLLYDRVLPDNKYDIYYFIASILLINNWGVFNFLAWNIPAWSISTEFFSYLLFPLLLILIKQIKRLNIIVPSTLFFLLIFWLINFYSNSNSIGDNIPKIGLFRCVNEFILGMLCYLITKTYRIYNGKHTVTILLFSSFIFFLPILLQTHSLTIITTPIGSIGIIYGTLSTSDGVRNVLTCKPIYLLGLISYSIYIFHYLFLDLFKLMFSELESLNNIVNLIIYLLFLFIFSYFSFIFIETKFRNYLQNKYYSLFRHNRF